MKGVKVVFAILLGICLAIFTNYGTAAVDESLVLYLSFDEGSGDVAGDLSDKGNDGTLNGANWVDGKINGALEFNGSSFVEIPHSESLSPEVDITVMAWAFMEPGSSGELMIISKGDWAANDLPYELSVTPGSSIYWQFYDDAGRDTCSPTSPPVGEWHHIAGTYDGDMFICYVDGVLGEEWAYSGVLPQNVASVTIGKRSKSAECYFQGSIDEVAVFDRVLSEAEINEMMNGIDAAVDVRGKLPVFWGEIKSKI